MAAPEPSAEDVASRRQQGSGLQELLERMHVKMAYASKKRAES